MIKAVEIKRKTVPGDANTTGYKSRYQFSGNLQTPGKADTRKANK